MTIHIHTHTHTHTITHTQQISETDKTKPNQQLAEDVDDNSTTLTNENCLAIVPTNSSITTTSTSSTPSEGGLSTSTVNLTGSNFSSFPSFPSGDTPAASAQSAPVIESNQNVTPETRNSVDSAEIYVTKTDENSTILQVCTCSNTKGVHICWS